MSERNRPKPFRLISDKLKNGPVPTCTLEYVWSQCLIRPLVATLYHILWIYEYHIVFVADAQKIYKM